MRFFITGHTGFKGSWLTMMLTSMGHEVHGFALDPGPESLFTLANVDELCASDVRADIRDESAVSASLRAAQPDVVLHLAAQPLVPDSYRRPRWTFETNVVGTMNLLEATQTQEGLKAIVVVTTDKVYRNNNQIEGYAETDPLGGEDPYSASKAMSDLLAHAWSVSFGGPITAIARAGNVIGGGDYSTERLIPDIIRAVKAGRLPELRYPQAVRPWQHVLDCLNGYITLAMALANGSPIAKSGDAWNFGPTEDSFVTVGEVTSLALEQLGVGTQWEPASGEVFHEAGLLALDSSKATKGLAWRNRLDFADSLTWTLDWYSRVDRGMPPREVTMDQVLRFRELRP